MIFIAEGRDSEIHRRNRTVLLRLGFRVFDRPPRVTILSANAKVFGLGRLYPHDRNAKARILTRPRAFMRPRRKGAPRVRYRENYAVLAALLYRLHNSKTAAHDGY